MQKTNYMRYIFFLLSLWLIVGSGKGLCQQARPDDISDANSSLKEQQKQLNTQLIEYAQQQVNILNSMKDYIRREQYDSTWDYLPDIPQFQQQMRRNRGDDEFNYFRARLDVLKLKTMETESKKNDLIMKVLDSNKQPPGWWDTAEAEFIERKRQVVQSGLRR